MVGWFVRPLYALSRKLRARFHEIEHKCSALLTFERSRWKFKVKVITAVLSDYLPIVKLSRGLRYLNDIWQSDRSQATRSNFALSRPMIFNRIQDGGLTEVCSLHCLSSFSMHHFVVGVNFLVLISTSSASSCFRLNRHWFVFFLFSPPSRYDTFTLLNTSG